MKLYTFPVAPNPTKVRLYLAEKRAGGAGIEVEEVTVRLVDGEQRRPEHLARNPFGKLPVLETERGDFLFESLPIIDFFEELHPDPPLFGDTPLSRARARQIERLADLGVLIPIARIVHTTRSPLGLPPNPEVAEYFRSQLPAGLDYLDALLEDDRSFLAGERVTVADCTLAAGLHFGRFRELDFLEGHDRLRAWDERYRARPEVEGILLR
ncbi:MAG: glutathione S-transferase family protein [bacterium]